MELRDFAWSVVHADSLEAKLAPPPELTDREPGLPCRPPRPGRPANLRIVPAREARVPSPNAFRESRYRPRILHALANHELQAAELFAWALLAFPSAPASFRRGLLGILRDEQRHTRMYLSLLAASDTSLGDHPVSGYFWGKAPDITSPARFVCAMSLTFENANLDHTLEQAAIAREAGDERTAATLEQVHADEIEHVRFGWQWLCRFRQPQEAMWTAYSDRLAWPLRGALARGRTFHAESRRIAGLDREFIDELRLCVREKGLTEEEA
jgi:uncharacterized ferritin-like protein (DUF455 family)